MYDLDQYKYLCLLCALNDSGRYTAAAVLVETACMAPVRARDPTAATSTTIVLQLSRTTRVVRYALLLLARDMISTLLV